MLRLNCLAFSTWPAIQPHHTSLIQKSNGLLQSTLKLNLGLITSWELILLNV